MKPLSPLVNAARNNKYILLSFFAAAGILLVTACSYGISPFGELSVLQMDLYHQYAPLLTELRDRIVQGKSLIYSWQSGGGGSFIGNFFTYLSSPLSLLILLFGRENTAEAAALIILVKCSLSAASFSFYAKHSASLETDSPLSAGFGLLYAFSGYFIAYYWNLMWLDAMFWLPLIALGIEYIIRDGRPLLYSFSLSLAVISNYYTGYMLCIFSLLFACCCLFEDEGARAQKSEGRGEKKSEDCNEKKNLSRGEKMLEGCGGKKNLSCGEEKDGSFKKALRFAEYSLLSGGLSAFVLLPMYFILKKCSAAADSLNDDFSMNFSLFDFAACQLSGTQPTIRSSGESVLPNICCGMLTLLLFILFLYCDKISLREKISKCSLLFILFLSMAFRPLDFLWHGFHFPNDLPYRFSFIYSFVILITALKALKYAKYFRKRDILGAGLALTAFIALAQKISSSERSDAAVIIALVFTAAYCLLLSLHGNKEYLSRFGAASLSVLLFCCIFAEVSVSGCTLYDIDQHRSSYAENSRDFERLKRKIAAAEESKFFRTEFAKTSAVMSPSLYGYNGISVFSSAVPEKEIKLKAALGTASNQINSCIYTPQTPVFNALFSLGYLIDEKDNEGPKLCGSYYSCGPSGRKLKAYKNNYCLPIAFCASGELENQDFGSSDPFENQSKLFGLATGTKELFHYISADSVEGQNLAFFDKEERRGSYIYKKDELCAPSSMTLSFTPLFDGNVYIYLYSYGTDEFTLRNLSGNFSMTEKTEEPHIRDCGTHRAGEKLFIDIPLSEAESGSIEIYIVQVDAENFRKGFEKLNDSGALKLKSFDETELSGTLKASENEILLSSINYDEGWRIFIDGHRVPEKDILKIGNALIGVRLNEGPHEIEMKYVQKGLRPGILISLLSLGLTVMKFYFLPKYRKFTSSYAQKIAAAEHKTKK